MSVIKNFGILTEKIAWLFLEWRRFNQKRLVSYDITIQQRALLNELNKNEFLSPNEIANYLHCDRPTASVIIKNLEKKDWIYRKKDEKNAKFHKILISEKGKEILQSVNSSVQPLTISPFDVLTSEESEQLFYLLKKCEDRMNEIKDSKENNNE
ncbi:DNA-binding transcriptional regulator, MarR family [Clostridium acidisoli DSM 12555]|uniref:DNA-binding transcriptional regulator, MarR family n=1 Tax=Clostridium acidisoli DSM 12555 TaxID=1121291 RepID=A0A1W1WYK9_9CLOT|nr:MarR family winged helix-turn-helix transcriptional regulator [Clostridium acidisoli]SMC16518.1 DNA-binding transcriptional regulator, MarR family [Clostridium acidisoli DSM 12555]